MNELKSSKEILDTFFEKMSKRDGLHKPTVDALVALHQDSKLTKTNVTNAIEEAREKSDNDENKQASN